MVEALRRFFSDRRPAFDVEQKPARPAFTTLKPAGQ
jgi:hypothetical protein